MALQKYSNLPKNKVIGQAGVLDTSRFAFFISEKLNVNMNDYEKYIAQRQEKQKEDHRIENIENEVSEIKSNLDEIKDLLKNLSK